MLARTLPLEGFVEVAERELQHGVHVEREPEREGDSSAEILGGLITAEEHISVHELPAPKKETR